MFIALLTLLSALSISGVAAYYSIIGLATIFPGAFIPVVLMGSVLEAGKLVCASWLYRNWKQTNVLLRSYLFFAVIVLSIVTSMGIFGFLSKAHLQNEFADGSVQQKIELINSQIKTEESIITRQQEIINRAFGKDTSTTVRLNQLNERLRQLDKEVEAYTSQGTGVFKGDNVKKGLAVKETQKEEREQIQNEIRQLTNKSTASTQDAENKIAQSQQKITDLISQRDPLVAEKLKLEAEIGPIKYIAALAVDFGWSQEVNANSAVRWVIIILIFVFDPLAVLMLVAANQSFLRKFPVKIDPPEEIIDLEKPDLDPPPVVARAEKPAEDPAVSQWNSMIDKMNELAAMEREANNKKLADTVAEWQSKLDKFNEKVDKPKPKQVEIVPVKEEKKSEDTVTYDLGNAVSNQQKDEIVKVDFKVEQSAEPTISEQIEEAMQTERYKPDFTEVVELEKSVQEPKKPKTGILGQQIVDKKSKSVIQDIPRNDFERKGLLNKLHQEHGNYQDISDVELKKERDTMNVQRFLDAVPVTEEDARTHPAITKSRMSFFEDYLDDIKRGDTEAENLPPDIAKTCAILLSEFDNPEIVEPSMQNTAVEQTGLSTMTPEELKEHFAIEPKTEDRDMTEEELENLLKGFEDDDVKGEYDVVIKGGKKIKVPKKNYVQNEEQSESTTWNKIKELDLPEPEKNELNLPNITSTSEEEVPEITESVEVESLLPTDKIAKHKNKMLSDEQYREKIETRINDLITKIENREIKLNELTQEDQKVIIELLNKN